MGNLCANHPAAAARFHCVPCGTALCEACVRLLRDGKTAECGRCGSLALPSVGPISARQRFESPVIDPPLIERLPGTVRWLGRRSVVLVLLATAVFQWLAGLLFLRFLSAGIAAALFFYIVERAANGDDDLDTPDFVDWQESIAGPLLRFVATLLPLFAALYLGGLSLWSLGSGEWKHAGGAALAILLIWFALWPLLIMVAAISRSILAVYDPRVWWKTLVEMRVDYVVAAVAFYAVLFFDSLVLAPALVRVAMAAPLFFFMPVAVNFIFLATQALRGRILGEACRPYL